MTTPTGISLAAVFLLAAALSGTSQPVADPAAAARCSIAPFHGSRSEQLYFTGTTLPDTVLVGSGAVTPSGTPGHWGPGTSRAVYGQLVRIDLLGAEAPDALRQQPRDRRTIIVVPWDYDGGCKPTYWSRSAAWVDADLEGFYTVRLRPPSEWPDDVPVADAFFADIQPYPHGSFFRAGYRGTSALREQASLAPREYFSLYSVLPTPSELRDDSSAVLARLQSWEDANHAVARHYPAELILNDARRQLQLRR